VAASIAVLLRIPILNFDDFESYSAGLQRAISGESLYSPVQLSGPYGLAEAAGGAGFVYPPSAAVLLLPTLLGNWVAIVMMVGAFAAMLFGIVRISSRELPELPWFGGWSER